MNAFAATIAICACIVACQAATTQHPNHHHSHHTRDPSATHATKEPSEHEHLGFFYIPATHTLVMTVNKNCYVATLDAAELAAIHTDAGLRSVELRLVNSIASATATTSAMLDATEVKHCGHNPAGYFTIP